MKATRDPSTMGIQATWILAWFVSPAGNREFMYNEVPGYIDALLESPHKKSTTFVTAAFGWLADVNEKGDGVNHGEPMVLSMASDDRVVAWLVKNMEEDPNASRALAILCDYHDSTREKLYVRTRGRLV
jgi:hypothetical protein